MIAVMCMGGRAGYGPGCGTVRRATKAELAAIRRESDVDLEVATPPSDCPECGECRQFEGMSESEYLREVNG